ETVLIALLRGGGLEALAGMRPVTPGTGIVRPLLEVTRAEIEAFCRSLRLRPLRDPMNEDRSLLRAAVRHDVLPALEASTGRGVRSCSRAGWWSVGRGSMFGSPSARGLEGEGAAWRRTRTRSSGS